MSGQDLIDTLSEVYGAYAQGDPGPFFGLLADDALMRFAAPAEVFPFAAPRRGPAGAKESLALIAADYEWRSYGALELIAEDNLAFALNGGRIRHRASGRETVLHMADLVRFENGKIVEFAEFFDSAGLLDWQEGAIPPAVTDTDPANKLGSVEGDDPARNKALLNEAFAAYGRRDPGPMIDLLSDDASYNSVAQISDFRFAGPCYGKAQFMENMARIAEDYDLERYEVLDMIGGDDLVAVHSEVGFRHRQSGLLAEAEKIDLFRMRGGCILEFNEFFDSLSVRKAYAQGGS